MKQFTHIILLALILLVGSTACTRNDGDIGMWFGTWHVTGITADGLQVDLDPANNGDSYFLQFQNSVVCLRHVDRQNNGGESYGSWQENDEQFTIDFPEKDARDVMLPGLSEHNVFTLVRHNDKELELHQIADGKAYVYSLKKLY